jgi:hypothetical protein
MSSPVSLPKADARDIQRQNEQAKSFFAFRQIFSNRGPLVVTSIIRP